MLDLLKPVEFHQQCPVPGAAGEGKGGGVRVAFGKSSTEDTSDAEKIA